CLGFTQQVLEAGRWMKKPNRTAKTLVGGQESLNLQQSLDSGPQRIRTASGFVNRSTAARTTWRKFSGQELKGDHTERIIILDCSCTPGEMSAIRWWSIVGRTPWQ